MICLTHYHFCEPVTETKPSCKPLLIELSKTVTPKKREMHLYLLPSYHRLFSSSKPPASEMHLCDISQVKQIFSTTINHFLNQFYCHPFEIKVL